MPKLTVREQEALTETIINKIQKAQAEYAKEDFKLIEKDINDIKSRCQHLTNEKKDIENKLKSLDEQHSDLVNKFNEGRRFVAYKQRSNDYYSPNILKEWGICEESDYSTRQDISRDVIVSALKTNEDMEKIIVDLVNAHQPWRDVKKLWEKAS